MFNIVESIATLVLVISFLNLWFPVNFNPTSSARFPYPKAVEIKSNSLKTNQKSVFMCVIGQLGRLLLTEKKSTIIKPLEDAGYSVHTAIVIDGSSLKTRFTNNNKKSPFVSTYETLEQVKRHIQELNMTASVELVQDFDTPVNEFIFSSLDKKYMECESRLKRAKNHIKMYTTMDKCGEIYRKLDEENEFDFSIKVRDDTLLGPGLFEGGFLKNNLDPNGIIASNCASWSGLNDKAAIVGRDVVYDFFQGPLAEYKKFTCGDNGKCPKNPETFLKSVMHIRNVTVSADANFMPWVVRHTGNIKTDKFGIIDKCYDLRTECERDKAKAARRKQAQLNYLNFPFCTRSGKRKR